MQLRARPIREATDRDSVQTSLTLSSAPVRVPFSSYLQDIQTLILPRTQVDLPTVCYCNNSCDTGGCGKSEKAVEYECALLFLTRRDLSMSALILCPTWARDHIYAFA